MKNINIIECNNALCPIINVNRNQYYYDNIYIIKKYSKYLKPYVINIDSSTIKWFYEFAIYEIKYIT